MKTSSDLCPPSVQYLFTYPLGIRKFLVVETQGRFVNTLHLMRFALRVLRTELQRVEWKPIVHVC
jgi:hypothetical protein